MKNVGIPILLVVMMTMAFPAPTFARLGETKAECQERYDNLGSELSFDSISMLLAGVYEWSEEDSLSHPLLPILKGASNLAYDYQGWCIKVAFVDGKAVKIAYLKYIGGHYTSYRETQGQPIEPYEVLAILDGEAGGGTWEKSSSGESVFYNTNGSLARLIAKRKTLLITTPDVKAFVAEQQKKAEQRKMDEQQKMKEALPKF